MALPRISRYTVPHRASLICGAEQNGKSRTMCFSNGMSGITKQVIFSALVIASFSQATVTAGRKPLSPAKDPRLEVTVGEIRILMRDVYYSHALQFADGSIITGGSFKPNRVPAEYVDSINTYPQTRNATSINRRVTDSGRHWRVHPHVLPEGSNGLQAILKDGTAILTAHRTEPLKGKIETYVGKTWISRDNWLNVNGPTPVYITTPQEDVVGYGDGGPKDRIAGPLFKPDTIILDNGDLIGTATINWTADAKFSIGRMKRRTILIKSTDRGNHWKHVSTIASMASLHTDDPNIFKKIPQGFCEPTLALLANGDFLAVMRTGVRALPAGTSDTYDDLKYTQFKNGAYYTTGDQLAQPLYITRSIDGGKTWAKQKAMDGPRGVLPRLHTLSNGVVALSYGRIARPSQGNRIIFSTDNENT